MKPKLLTIEEFTTSNEAMFAVSNLQINPVIYRDTTAADIARDLNKALVANEIPYAIMPPVGNIHYLRFEAERLDRVFYILGCLIDPDLQI